MRYSEGRLCHGSRIWPKSDVTRRQRPIRALISFTLQRNLVHQQAQNATFGLFCAATLFRLTGRIHTHLYLDFQWYANDLPWSQPIKSIHGGHIVDKFLDEKGEWHAMNIPGHGGERCVDVSVRVHPDQG